MIGAKLDGETQRKKLISTRHPNKRPRAPVFGACQSKKEKKLKRTSPKAANIHNRWLSCRRQRSLRFKE